MAEHSHESIPQRHEVDIDRVEKTRKVARAAQAWNDRRARRGHAILVRHERPSLQWRLTRISGRSVIAERSACMPR